jgi:hypothetical protein
MRPRSAGLRRELSYLRESLVSAIRARNEQAVDENLEIYRTVVEAFIERLQRYGAVYDRALAHREGAGLPSNEDWQEIDWIRDDATDILREAFEHPHQGILFSVLYFPFSVSSIALEKGDYLTFARLSEHLPGFAYELTFDLANQRLRQEVVDRIPRYIREFFDFRIAVKIEHATTVSELSRIAELAEGFLLVFNRLLKAAFDHRRLADFTLFMTSMTELSRRFSDNLAESQHWELTYPTRIDLSRSEGPNRELHELAANVVRRFRSLQDVLRFGLASWIAQLHASGAIESEVFAQWFRACNAFDGFGHLTNVYLEARRLDTSDRFGWSWWVTAGLEGQVVTINFDRYLDRAFVLSALSTRNGPHEADTQTDRGGDGRDFEYLASGPDSPLQSILSEIVRDRTKWELVLPPNVESAAAQLRQTLDGLVQREQRERAELIVSSELDPRKVEAFKRDILAGYGDGGDIQQIILEVGGSVTLDEIAPLGTQWGFNLLIPKEMFVDASNVFAEGIGSSYGAELASSQDERFLGAIRASLATRPTVASENTVDLIAQAVSDLRARLLEPTIVLLRTWQVYAALVEDKRFKPESSQGAGIRRGLIGRLDGVPVYNTHSRSAPGVLISDFRRLGVLRRFVPNPPEGDEVLGARFVFGLRAVTDSDARRFIEERPDEFLAGDRSEVRLDIDEGVRRLMQRARFRLLDATDYSIEDATAGYSISISGTEA